MKKKILLALTFVLMAFAFVGCDLLSTINAVSGFTTEYNKFNPIYQNTTYLTVQTDTNLTISNNTTDLTNILPVDSKLYFMIDQTSPYVYVDETADGVRVKSVYENTGNQAVPVVQFVIGDNNVVTPQVPVGEGDYYNNQQIFNSNFNVSDVSNENKTGDRTYEFDVFLNQVVNLKALDSFVAQLTGQALTDFQNAKAHVIVTFADAESTIDVQASVSNYTINFDDGTSITFTLTNHTVLKIPAPADFSIPDVMSSNYQMVAVDSMDLALKVYQPGETIQYPVTSGENGYVQLNLPAGTYSIESSHLADMANSMIYDSSNNQIPFDSGTTFTIANAGTYYLHVVPTASFESDIQVVAANSSTTTTTTTMTTTTASDTTTTETNTNTTTTS